MIDNRARIYRKVVIKPAEEEAFRAAAQLAAMTIPGWMRERLRRAAEQELTAAGKPVPFLRIKT